VLVPGHPPKPWELTAIPHGTVSRHLFTTHVAKNLPEDQEAYLVYTPPGYNAKRKRGYPVLYLLHGWSDTETGWTEVGRANLIFDSMLDDGKIVPMIVVMPLGYGNFDFVTSREDVWHDAARVDENTSLYSQMLETEIIPMVTREYNIAPGRENYAIAGLSMGGLESLTIGLNHANQFAWIGGFSSAIELEHFDEHMPNLNAKQTNLRLLWVACGTSDEVHIGPSRDFVAWAKAKGLPVTAVETPGQHTWLVWRDNLLHFAPLLFR
jgi:enterochelin esterase family protein